MAKELQLSVVAPDRSVVETVAQSVICPGVVGYFGVMVGHEPMVVALRAGIVEYEDLERQRHQVAISGGFAEVSTARVMILADSAIYAQEIDVAKEEEKLDKARKALRGEDSSMTSTEAVAEVEKAMVRIRAAKARTR